MLRSCLSQASRPLTQVSFAPSKPSISSFHTATALYVTRRQGQSTKKQNVQRSQARQKKEAENQPSVVLGTRPNEETHLWPSCDLAQCLVNAHNLNGPPASSASSSSSTAATASAPAEAIEIPGFGTTVAVPQHLNYGVGEIEKKILFEDLPVLSAQGPLLRSGSNFNAVFGPKAIVTPEMLAQRQVEAVERETVKMDAFAKVLDLRNANAKGIAYENRKRIILAFSTPENPFDPGRAEVQAALLTYQIRNLWGHLTKYKRDVGNRLGLRKLIHQRAKILRYLKSKNQDRYESLLPRLALDPTSVEGELVI